MFLYILYFFELPLKKSAERFAGPKKNLSDDIRPLTGEMHGLALLFSIHVNTTALSDLRTH